MAVTHAAGNSPEKKRRKTAGVASEDSAMEEAKSQYRVVTKEELARHNSADDCWICIHGCVINFDKALQKEHPGGPEVVTAEAGTDCTQTFEGVGHSDDARKWGDNLIIGYLEGTPEAMQVGRVARNSDRNAFAAASGSNMMPMIVGAVALAGAGFYSMSSFFL